MATVTGTLFPDWPAAARNPRTIMPPQELASTWAAKDPPSLSGIKGVVLDTETTGLDWRGKDVPVGIAVGYAGRAQYLPFGHARGNLDEGAVRRWALAELPGKHVTGANIRFDVHMLRKWGVDLEAMGCQVTDVQHHAALLDDHRKSFSLESLSRAYLGVGKLDGLDVTRMREYSAASAGPYAEQDVLLTGQLAGALRPRLEEEDLLRVLALEDEVIWAVCEMERNGAPLDMPALRRWVLESAADHQEALYEIFKAVGFHVNLDSGPDMQKLFRHLGLTIAKTTAPTPRFPEGQPSFTADALSQVDHPVIRMVTRASLLADLRSKFLVPYCEAAGETGLLPYSLHQLACDQGGTVAGRFSASNKNIQQVMTIAKQREKYGEKYPVKELFVPGSGRFLTADAEQIEFRIFAHYAKSERLLKVYRDDPRSNFHKVVHGLLEPFRPGFPYKKTKNVNFARIYGGGAHRIAEMLGISEDAAREFLAIYDQAFPEVRQLMRAVSSVAETRGYVRTLTGRRARFPGAERLHKALNRVIQGSAADIMKRKLVELHAERRRTGFTMRMTVHDEVCGDAPDIASARMVDEILNRQTTPLKVPILWKTETGKTWGSTTTQESSEARDSGIPPGVDSGNGSKGWRNGER